MHTVLGTDTQRIPAHVGAADICPACLAEFGGPVEPEHSLLRLDDDTTVEFFPPWLRPPVTSTYCRPDRWQVIRGSGYVADVYSGWQRALAVLGALGIAYFLLLVARGVWVAAELLAAMTRPDQVQAACLAITVLSAIGLLLLASPRSFLSRLVDDPAETATREVTR